MFDLPSRTAVVAHDAGAANIIFSWVTAGAVPDEYMYLAGPAASLWSGRRQIAASSSSEFSLEGIEALVSGTGWASDAEHMARRAAREKGIRSIAVVDHWVNYAERFQRENEIVLPDEIWITDEYAEDIARRTFPGCMIRRVPNLYFEAEVARIPACPNRATAQNLLYVLEPARSNWRRGKAGEFQALDYLVEHLDRLGMTEGARLRLRPHPSEPRGKYHEWVERHFSIGAMLDVEQPLSSAIANADIVAGCNSFGLAVALAAGRRVVCCLPPWAPDCVLPHRGLIHLKDIA